MSEQQNEQYNSVFSTPDPTMTIKNPKDFFGHPQGNTLSVINITGEDIIDAIKTLLQVVINFQQYFSNNAATATLPLQLQYEYFSNNAATATLPLQLQYELSFTENRRNTNRSYTSHTSHYYTNIQGWLQKPS